MFLVMISILLWLIQFSLNLAINLVQLAIYGWIFIALCLFVRFFAIIKGRQNKLKPDSNHSILITGATSGFGLALTKYYHKLGFTILAGYYNDAEPGHKELTQLNNESGRIHLIPMDVRSSESIKEAREHIDVIFSKNSQLKLYCLVNNAGICPAILPLQMESRNLIKSVIETNLIGSMMTIREFMPLLIESHGRIINVSSGLGFTPGEAIAVYGTTKAALYYLSRCLRISTQRYGVKTIVLIPGNLIKNTNITANMSMHKKRSWQEFNQDEQLLYKRIYKRLEDMSNESNDSLKKLKEGDSSVKVDYGLLGRAGAGKQNQSLVVRSLNGLKNVILVALETLTGSSDSFELEDSSVLEAFDDAIRSPQPELILFPGNRWYQFITGPSALYAPDALLDFFLFRYKSKEEQSVKDYIKRRALIRSGKME